MKYMEISPLEHPAKATLVMPGSKSYTNRALLLAAMTNGPVKITGPLLSDDTQAMISCLQALGVEIDVQQGFIEVKGDVMSVADRDYDLDADLSGTTMRFMLALCAVLPGRQTLRGGERLQERPVGSLAEALKQLGASIDYVGETGYPPVLVSTPKLTGKRVKISGHESSQYLSALLMVAPLAGGLEIEIEGELTSKPYVDMTIEAMRQFGVKVETHNNVYLVARSQNYNCSEYAVEGDLSSASYFFAIAALTGSTLTLDNINPGSLQADIGFLEILETMGNAVTNDTNAITIEGKAIQCVSVDMRDCPDQAQTLAVLAAFADGQTTLKGVESLRIKETERVQALQQELSKMNIQTSSTPDTLIIEGGQPKPAVIATYNDHRMAMAFAVAGTKLSGMVIQEPDVVSKTFPGFWDNLKAIGVGINQTEQP
jgi:3-phosphoshikimate 1-carboxyvinyltransferase